MALVAPSSLNPGLTSSHTRRPISEWAVLLPAWSMVLVLCTYAGYASLMMYNTPALSSTAWLDGVSLPPPPSRRVAPVASEPSFPRLD